MFESGEWLWWILTAALMLFFVIELLNFNKPQQKLLERIDSQEHRRTELRQRLEQLKEDEADLSRNMEMMDVEWGELEERRKEFR